ASHGQTQSRCSARSSYMAGGMSLEIGRHGAGGRGGDDAGILAAQSAFCADPTIGSHHWRHAMNILDGLRPALADLRERFGARIELVHAPRPNEVYCHAQMDLVPGFCAQLYRKWNGRVVSLFADDARGQDGVFYIYYVF